MRRKDREKDSSFAYEVLRDSEYATLATTNADGTPYCIPISTVLIDNAVYFHCATEGQKLTNIDANNSICISCVRHTKLVPDDFTTEYESTVAIGKCYIVSDDEEKIMALRCLCEKYAMSNMEHFEESVAGSLNKTCVCKIEIESITGKSNI
jgi:nitroimidazol reductase NimA-like FMN-containing flavoprotein (pyridoxamine 5'-phosphate oxidase superfamily)